MPLMRDPVLPQQVDYLMMECTYGDSVHGDPEAAYATFRDVVKRTVNRGGKIIVPAFAVGRTQELVYNLNRMISENEIAPLPVYVDSPLAVNASRIFQQFSNLFDEETQQFIKEERHPALNFKGLTYINSVDESKALNNRHDPMVIISASGMAETGRILHHLRNNIENPRNTILLVSYTAPDTLGRRLAEGAPQVRIFGQLFDVKAEVASINGLSAHAGQDMLLKYAQAAQGHLKEIILVHGEQGPADTFTQKLKEAGLGPVMYPAKLETMDI
jgi:metallo-beta-lactamase family protein